MVFTYKFFISKSVKFKSSLGREKMMRGIDITAPPSLPRHFAVRKGGRKHVFIGVEMEESDDDHNKAIVGGDGDINHND